MPTDDNMHDPRRAEVPKAPEVMLQIQAHEMVNMRLCGESVGSLLVAIWNAGAIAGMKAQYEHDQKVAKAI